MAKRGSNEIATSLSHFFEKARSRNIKTVSCFSDPCSGQNNNIGVVTMMLRQVCSFGSVEKIDYFIFEKFDGQNEGDYGFSDRKSRIVTSMFLSNIRPI